MRFPEIPKPETLERRYLGKLTKKALSFLKSLLKMDPAERLTTSLALQHQYLLDLYEQDPEYNQRPQSNIRSIDCLCDIRLKSR